MTIQAMPLARRRSGQQIGECAASLDVFDELIFRWSWLVLGCGAFAFAVMQGQEDAKHEGE